MFYLGSTVLSILIVLLFLTQDQLAHAEGADCVVSSDSTGPQKDPDMPTCAELYPSYVYDNDTSPWRVGIAVGIGERSNPLLNADDIPLYGVIQLSYFGDNFFFDNGDIGWYLAEEQRWNLNAIAGIGGERSFFSFLNTSSISFSPTSGDTSLEAGSPNLSEETDIEIEIPKRDYTVDGGLELLYHWRQSDIQIQLLTDLSGRHNGQEAWLAWAVPQRFDRLEIIPSLGLNWKSSQAANYYYGVRESEATLGLPAYEAGSATNFFGRLAISYALDAHWKVVSVLQYEKLAHEIVASPIVENDHVQTGFVGLYYEF